MNSKIIIIPILMLSLLVATTCNRSEPPKEKHAEPKHEHKKQVKFDNPEEWIQKFENPERDEWQQPDKVITELKLKPDALVAEIGSGTGYFATRLAKAVPQGKVFAIDIESKMVDFVKNRALKENLKNLKAVQGTGYSPNIPEPVDVILLVNTYHHIENRMSYFRRLQSVLKPGGKIVVVDYVLGKIPYGPPDSMKLTPQQVHMEMDAAGFGPPKAVEFLKYQYFLVFERKKPAP